MLTHEQKERIGFKYIINLIEPVSPYGKEALRCAYPASPGQEEELSRKLQNIEKAIISLEQKGASYTKLEELLVQTRDVRNSVSRIGDVLSEVDLFEIKRYLLQLKQIVPLFNEINKEAKYNDITIENTVSALKILDPENTKIATFHISSKSFPHLAEIRKEKSEIEKKLRAELCDEEKAELTAKRVSIASKEQKEEKKAALQLSKELEPWREVLLQNARAIGRIDLTIQKAKLAIKYKTCLPKIGGDSISFTEMTNPQINDILAESGKKFTPLSIELRKGTTVITGANMGGKSVALKALALNILLIHHGFYPFAEKASCPLLDSIYLISDDLEAVDRGLSSFGGEVVKLQEVLNEAVNTKTIILLDEFARGTNPTEGKAIAGAVCAYMNKQESYTAMTTHYDDVAGLAGAHYQVAGLRKMELTESLMEEMQSLQVSERVTKIAKYMDYGLLKVSPGEKLPEDAVNICKLLGVEKGILDLLG